MKIWATTFIIFLFVFANSVFAQNTKIYDSGTSIYFADDIYSFKNIKIDNDEFSLTAKIGYIDRKKQIIAVENVTYSDRSLIISARIAEIHFTPKAFQLSAINHAGISKITATIRSSKFSSLSSVSDFLNQTNLIQKITFKNNSIYEINSQIYAAAKTIEKSRDSKWYILTDGSITRCPPALKDWEIEFGSLYIDIDKLRIGFAVNSRFEIRDIPVFYFPVIPMPFVITRHTGFLIPRLSWQKIKDAQGYGLLTKIPYFIAFDQEHDLTITPEIYSHRGFAIDFEYNFAFKQHQEGSLNLWGISETLRARDPTTETGMQTNDNPKPTRYTASLNYKDRFGSNQLFFSGVMNSDNEVRNDYKKQDNDTESKLLFNPSFVVPGNKQYFFSYIYHKKLFTSRSRYNFATQKDTLSHIKLDYTRKLDQIFGKNLDFNVNLSFSNFSREEGWQAHKASVIVKSSYIGYASFLRFDFDFINKVDYYMMNKTPGYTVTNNYQDRINFFLSNSKASLTTSFELKQVSDDLSKPLQIISISPYARIDFINDKDQRMLLDVKPSDNLNFTYVDYENFGQKFKQSTLDPARNSITFGAKFNLLRKDNQSNSDFSNLSINFFGIWDLLRTKDLSQKASKFKGPIIEEQFYETSLNENLLPLRLDISYKFSKKLNLSFFGRYSIKESRLLELALGMKVNLSDKMNLNLNYINNDKSYRFLDGRFYPKLNSLDMSISRLIFDRLEVEMQRRLNFLYPTQTSNNFKRVNTVTDYKSIKLKYINCCYNISFYYLEELMTKNNNPTIEKDYIKRSFGLRVRLF